MVPQRISLTMPTLCMHEHTVDRKHGHVHWDYIPILFLADELCYYPKVGERPLGIRDAHDAVHARWRVRDGRHKA